MSLKRRAFLQQMALALGVSGATLLGWADQCQQAIAKPTRRKLALLIGINQYPERAVDPILTQDIALKGALTDLELQRELLMYRFGFAAADIVTLKDQEATRQGIFEALDQHLIQQARPDDVVLLHFSGYGSQVRLETDPNGAGLAWVPVDGRLPTEQSPALADVLEAELVARLKFLKTSDLTTIVDAGVQDLGLLRWGLLKVRSRPTVPTGTLPDPLAIDLASWRVPQWPGLVLRGGEPENLVLEGQWHDFSAGVFTYALTQTLWETTETLTPKVLIHRSLDNLKLWTGPIQQPVATGTAKSDTLHAYRLPGNTPPADGLVLASSNDRPLTLWLGGIPATVLEYLQPGSRLLTAPTRGTSDPGLNGLQQGLELRIESRNRLRAVAKVVDSNLPLPAAGQPVYEKLRLLPRNIDLIVALDNQLERVERVDATSALASIPFVVSTAAGEQPADCLFGRLPADLPSMLMAALPTGQGLVTVGRATEKTLVGNYGLFTPNRTLIPGTLQTREEAVKSAVGRLMPHLQTLLAMKLMRSTQNQSSSWLGAHAVLEITQPRLKPVIWHRTERSGLASSKVPGPKELSAEDSPQLNSDNRILYSITNTSDCPLHFALISFNSLGDCRALVAPPQDLLLIESNDAAVEQRTIAPGQTQTLPDNGADWGIPKGAVWVETHIVLSVLPLQSCLEVLQQSGETSLQPFDLERVKQPLKLAHALLEDLSRDTATTSPELTATDYYALPQDRWVTFTFRYAVG